MQEHQSRWLGHVLQRPKNAITMRSDETIFNTTVQYWSKPKQTFTMTIRRAIKLVNLMRNMPLKKVEWRKKIHKDNCKDSDKGLVLLMLLELLICLCFAGLRL